MTDLDQLKTYLGAENAAQWTDADLLAVIEAEKADQAARCRVPALRPASLSEALWRRVARNLALRSIPLGIMSAESGGVRVSRMDVEVRRFEAPYRRAVVG